MTGLEGVLYFGFADVAKGIAWLRWEGFKIETRTVKLSTVVAGLRRSWAPLSQCTP